MAVFKLSKEFSKVLLTASGSCRCGFSCTRGLSTLTKNGKNFMIPNRFLKVARYYEKPKEKKGPTGGSYAFLAGAATGILIGAVAYFGIIYVNYKISILLNAISKHKPTFVSNWVIKITVLRGKHPGWKIGLFLPTRSCNQKQFIRCDVRAKPISRRHATKSKELLAKSSHYLMSCMCYYPFSFLLVLHSS